MDTQLLIDVTGCDREEAVYFLELADGDVNGAYLLYEAAHPERFGEAAETTSRTSASNVVFEADVPPQRAPPVRAAARDVRRRRQPAGRGVESPLQQRRTATPVPRLPRWVRQSPLVSFEAVVEEARAFGTWLLVLLHESSIDSQRARHAFWSNRACREFHGQVICFDVNVEEGGGRRFAREYHAEVFVNPIQLVLLNPLQPAIPPFHVPLDYTPEPPHVVLPDALERIWHYMRMSTALLEHAEEDDNREPEEELEQSSSTSNLSSEHVSVLSRIEARNESVNREAEAEERPHWPRVAHHNGPAHVDPFGLEAERVVLLRERVVIAPPDEEELHEAVQLSSFVSSAVRRDTRRSDGETLSLESSLQRETAAGIPSWVRQDIVVGLESMFEEARVFGAWVLVLLHANQPESQQARHAFWSTDTAQELREQALMLDLSIEEEEGLQLAQRYHAETFLAPIQLLVLHPVTMTLSWQVPLRNTREAPHVDLQGACEELRRWLSSAPPALPRVDSSVPLEVTDDGAPVNETPRADADQSRGLAVQSHAAVEAPRDVRDVTGADPPSREGTSPAAVRAELPEVVSLQPFEAPAGPESLKLRLQFPKGPLDVVLSKATPLQSLLGYCSHRLHMEHREKYPLRPREPYFLGGFPPQRLEMPASPTATLGECSALRNGVKITATAEME